MTRDAHHMKKLFWILPLAAGAASWFLLYPQAGGNASIAMPEAVSYRLLFGIADTSTTRWDGSVRVQGGTVRSIQGWRFADSDSTDNQRSWKLSTRAPVVRGGAKKGAFKKKGGPGGATADNGVVVTATLQDPKANFQIETPQGNFSFSAAELPFGEAKVVLDGKARVERVPASVRLTDSNEEQDHPALAKAGEDVYLAYVDFTHGDRSQDQGRQFTAEPKSFDYLARPVGGDQIKLMRYSPKQRVWTAIPPASASGQDIMRVAIAADDKQRVWVVWSANKDGNFDLYAKRYAGGQWSAEMRVTSSTGPDLNPVAATDSTGRVWIAWQGYRNGSLDILAASAEGDRFGVEHRVSTSMANDWDASISAGSNGDVAVAWDTYDKGDYDVYLRRMRFGGGVKMDAPVAIAASANFEARPSVAYDSRNRIWIAYEGSDVKWGKDFGAYETSGIGLYQGHTLKLRVLDGQALSTTTDDLADALPAATANRQRRRAQQQQSTGTQQPNPELAKSRPPSGTPQPPALPKNSFPRLASDSAGNVYLAYRLGTPMRAAAGPVWSEQVVYFDGSEWKGPIDVPSTDAFMDIRPALLSTGPGQLLMVSTTDKRQNISGPPRQMETLNTDLFAHEISVASRPQAAKLQAVNADKPATDADTTAERQQIQTMRNYRADVAGRKMQLVRGEFHRHTELSSDGGMADGPVIDAYRYMLDAAAMDWGGCCDHDNGNLEYYWWIEQKLTDAYHLAGRYTPMFSYERSVRYPEGHRNTVMAKRGVRPLPRLAITAADSAPTPAPDTQMLYRYLRRFDGIVASHTSGTDMGTDWRDNDPVVEPVVEIYQGDRQSYEMPGSPRTNADGDSIGGWRPLGFVSVALQKGYKLGFQASSDHVSTHMSYCNLWVTDRSREAIMEAFKKRRVYGATDNILADVRVGTHFMGEEFAVKEPPVIQVKLVGTAPFSNVTIIKDGKNVYSAKPQSRTAAFRWRDDAAEKGKSAYYYVRGEQADGELVWVSPMWITYQ